MPRNGSGTYTLPAGNPVVTGTTISSTVQNNTTSDIATALTASIAKDGQTTPTANLPMGTYRHTGVGNGVAATDYTALGQAQSSAYMLIGTVAGADTITGVLTPTLTAYAAGQKFSFISVGANTGAVTINIDSLGAKSITKLGTTALAAGDIPSGAVVEIEYDGTRFQICNLIAGSVANLSGGVAGAVPYQSAASTTGFTAAGTSGYLFKSGGTGSPTWGDPVASTTNSGLVELATDAEVQTGTDTGRVPSVSSMRNGLIVLGTSQTTTSGTSKDFTGIPSWAKRIQFTWIGGSTNGTSIPIIQIGDSGGIENTGYSGVTNVLGVTAGVMSSGFKITESLAAASIMSVVATLELVDAASFLWRFKCDTVYTSGTEYAVAAGSKALTAALDRLRFTMANGTDAFDAGTAYIAWE